MRPFWVTLIIFAVVVACVSFLVVSCSAAKANGAELQPWPVHNDRLVYRRGVYVHVGVRPVVVVRRHPRRPPVVVNVR